MSNNTVAYHKGFTCDKRSCDHTLPSAAQPQTDELIAKRIEAGKKKKWRFIRTGRRLTSICAAHDPKHDPKGTQL